VRRQTAAGEWRSGIRLSLNSLLNRCVKPASAFTIDSDSVSHATVELCHHGQYTFTFTFQHLSA
jgi:hypothetical protein